MGKNLLFFFSVFFVVAGFSQEGGIPLPISWQSNLPGSPRVIQLGPLDMAEVRRQDSINDLDKSIPWRFGIERAVVLNMQRDGLWTDLKDGGKIWRVAIRSNNAVNLSVNFTDFYLPPGSRLQLYDNKRTVVSQTFTSVQNREINLLGTWIVEGDTVWMEYYQPAGMFITPRLQISGIIHGYRMGEVIAGFPTGNKMNDS